MKDSALHKIKKIKKTDIENFLIILVFESKEIKKVNLTQLFSKPQGLTSEVLKGNIFDKCFVDMGALAWPNGLELCADMLYSLATEQEKNRAA
jgi:hypothetical protein